MDIVHYISRLLFRYDCVIVPDFGGFIANYNPANYRSDIHLFAPPSKEIAFNSNLTNSDGLLANYIANCNQCSYNDASIAIANFIHFVISDLNLGKIVIFDGIGSFSKHSGTLVFEPDNTINRLIDAFGLPVLQMPLSEKEMANAIYVSSGTEKGNIIKKVLVAVPLVLILAFIPMKMSRFSVTGLTSSAGFSQFHLQNKQKKNILNNPTSLSDVIDKLNEAEYALYYSSEQSNKSTSFIDTIADTSFNEKPDIHIKSTITETTISESKTKIITTPTSDKKYFIIAGSFIEMSRVNVFCKELISKNFTPEIVDRDKKLRVSVGSFRTSVEANKALFQFRQDHPEYQVWLLGS
jgi:hypothetical protein